MAIPGGEIRRADKRGRISVGKLHAGQHFRVQQLPDGSLLLTAVMVPERQLWTLKAPDRGAIARGMAWAAATSPAETNLDDLLSDAFRRARRRRSRDAAE
jgi:hypothetical protein